MSDLLSAAFPVPVLRDQDALMTVASGAALAVRPQVRRPAPPSRPAPADEPGPAALAGIPTDAWPQVTRGGPAAAERPPRPPVTVAAIRPADR